MVVGSNTQQKLQIQEQKLEELRLTLDSALSSKVDDQTCLRFIRATNGDITVAAERLKTTSEWREHLLPECLVCTLCQQDPLSHYLHIVGFSRKQEPVMYSCLDRARDHGPAGNTEHMIETFEQAVRCMPPGVEQWIWFSDLHGFGLRDMNPATGRAFNTLAGAHYPERLSCMLFVDAPYIFYQLWNLLLPFVDPKTKSKLRVLPYDLKKGAKSKLGAALDELFDEELKVWLIKEMEANRVKSAKNRLYSQTSMLAAAQTADSPWLEQWGTRTLETKLRFNPSILLQKSQQLPPPWTPDDA